MRTTIDIDKDVLVAVKERARREKQSAGRVISNIVRESLTGRRVEGENDKFVYKNGLQILAPRGEVITLEHVQKIMDEEGI
jgi:hypothetical protein